MLGTMPYSEDPTPLSRTVTIVEPLPCASKKTGGRLVLGMIGIWICVICIGLIMLV